MKLASIFAMTIGAATGWQEMAGSSVLVRSVDGSPEALLIGGSLLMIAAILRHRLATHTK